MKTYLRVSYMCVPVYSILNLIYKLMEGGVGGFQNDTLIDLSMI